jgi:hypothetical protein
MVRSLGRGDLTPSSAAAGALDRLPVADWPMLAAYWLADGFDSEVLRELAGLSRQDTAQARELMPLALDSIGCHVVTEAELAARASLALAIVQRDLDATGFGEFVMRPVNLLLGPVSVELWAALPDGRSGSGGCDGMRPGMDDASLLWSAAHSVSDTLGEVLRIDWPVCAVHGGEPITPADHREVSHGLIGGAVWWWCRSAAERTGGTGHAVAPVGQLTPATARTR